MTSTYLLDTQALLLWRRDGPGLGRKAIRVLDNPKSQLLLSTASVWEISIKRSLGKLKLAISTEEFVRTSVAAGIRLLEIRPEHLYRLESLPWHHRDPFDRLLISQAQVEALAIIGKDTVFEDYGVRLVW